ncbi:DUF3322 domain-containing protein [Rhodococcus sp. NPDC054953]
MTGRVSPPAVAEKARAAYTSRRRRWLTDPAAAQDDSLSVALHPPSEATVAADPDAIREWVRVWRGHDGAGDVEWVTRRWPSFGTQEVPMRVVLRGAASIADAAGRADEWRRLLARRARLLTLAPDAPDLPAALASTATAWDALDETDFDRLRGSLRWLLEHPASGLLIRQLPVPGVDTKWITRHRGLTETLLTGIRGDGVLGVRTLPRLLDVAVLDRGLLPGAPRVFAASIDELATLPLRPATVLILENKEGVHALPDLPGTVAVHGGGYAVHEVAALPWLAGTAVRYWGDLDSHGFAILDRLRHHLPGVRSVLMDRTTLDRWGGLAVPEPAPATGDFTALTEDEAATLAMLRRQGLRLEQERIPWPYVLEHLDDAPSP